MDTHIATEASVKDLATDLAIVTGWSREENNNSNNKIKYGTLSDTHIII